MTNELPGYDQWKTTPPDEPLCDDEDCTCTCMRRDKFCLVHGVDPDDYNDSRRDD